MAKRVERNPGDSRQPLPASALVERIEHRIERSAQKVALAKRSALGVAEHKRRRGRTLRECGLLPPPKRRDHRFGQLDATAAPLSLGPRHRDRAVVLDGLLHDNEIPLVKMHVRPDQSEQLALPHTRRNRKEIQGEEPVTTRGFEERSYLFERERRNRG